MAATPQSNTTLAAMAGEMLRCDRFVICGHVSPDGDCLGSQLALMHVLRSLGKRVTCVTAGPDAVAFDEDVLPGLHELVFAGSFEGEVEAFVAVDVPMPERMGEGAALHARAAVTFTVDHHAVPEAMSRFSYTDPDAASTTMLVWELAKHLGVQPGEQAATCAYTGLMTDTGRFQFQNADAAAFAAAAEMVQAGARPHEISRGVYQNRSLASLRLESLAVERMMLSEDGAVVLSWLAREDFERFGATKADAEPIIDKLRSLTGVRVACVLREQEDRIRGSLRAKDDTDVAAIARRHEGGGHTAAAGFTFYGNIEAEAHAFFEELSSLVR